jgi:uncharacterized delta-60 repeat protein
MDRSKRRGRRNRAAVRLGSLFVIGALVAAACTSIPSARPDPDSLPPSPQASAPQSPDFIPPTPQTGAPRSQEGACLNHVTRWSERKLACGGNIGFRGLSPAYSVAIQADGKIVAVGGTGMFTGGGWDNNFAVARYKPGGSADATFGIGGRVAARLEPGQEAHSVAIQADGRIVVAGSPSYGIRGTVSLACYEPGGTPDATFSHNGWVVVPWVGRAHSVALQSDGGIVVAGESGGEVTLARFKPNGGLDTSFGADGLVTTTPSSGWSVAYAVAVQPDGRIVVAGRAGGGVLLARYEPSGDLDPAFGESGLITADFAAGTDVAFDVAIQDDRRIVVAGQAGGAILLARFEPNGSLDTDFGQGGRTITDVTQEDDLGRGIAIGADGEIVVTGGIAITGGIRVASRTAAFEAGRSAIVLYRENGSLDPSFGRHGMATSAFGEKAGVAYSVAIGADQSIVVAGLVDRPLGDIFDNGGGSFGFAQYEE